MIAATVISSLCGCSMLGSQTAPQATRFAVLFPNSLVPVPPELSAITDRLLGQITRYLAAQGRERGVIEPLEAQGLWLASIAEADQSDTVSHDFNGAMNIFARKLSGPAAFDALVIPALVYREGLLRNRIVKWDGVVRRLPPVGEDSIPIPLSLEASVPVVSLHVMVFSASGEMTFENYGGIDLVHSFTLGPGEEGQVQIKLRDPVLGKRRFLREGVEAAFDPYLPRNSIGKW